MANTDTTGLSTIGQIALSVSDIDRAVKFYRDCLGLPLQFQAPNMAFFHCDGVRLMLGINSDPSKPPHGTIVYFKVDDVNETYQTLIERGATIEREPQLAAKMPDHELWIGFIRDPDDNILGLMSEVPLGE